MSRNRMPLPIALAVTLLLASPQWAHAAPGLPSANVAWQPAANDADIEKAFSRARGEKKPVLLYWGATWCPPCNQLKATLFNRQDFATQSKSFVAVHVDGDRPGAQKLGSRFKVSGYPTVVLFNPEGQEITRLPGEVDAEQVMTVLQLGMSGGRPIKAVLSDAQSGKPLTPGEWRMLAFYSWETDQQQLVAKNDVAGVLTQLAVASSAADPETTTRLWLKTLAASDEGKGVKADAALRERVARVIADPARSRLHMDVLTNSAADIVKALSDDGSAERAPLVASLEAALRRLQADATLSRGDRLQALISRIDLARLGQPKEAMQVQIPEALLQEVRAHTKALDQEITDGYERQAVISSAAYALGRAGLWSDSDALLKGNLAKSISPYYLMSHLGSNARKQGQTDEALRWYQKSFETSQGPATRLQWGAGYVSALVDLAPQDAARIEATASQLFKEAGSDRGAFFERSARSLQRMGNKLVAWNKDGKQAATIKRLKARLDGVCAKVPAADGQKAACESVLKGNKTAA